MARRSTLVAVDTNVLLDLAVPKDKVHDAVEVFRQRVPEVEFVVLPTVLDEIDYISQQGDTAADRALATVALQNLVRAWRFRPLDFIPVGHGIVEAVAAKLRGAHLMANGVFLHVMSIRVLGGLLNNREGHDEA